MDKRCSFSLFTGGIKVTKPSQNINLEECFTLIRGDTYVTATDALRNAKPAHQKAYKARLDYVTFSGTFSPTRSAANLLQHSGLICLDFDKVPNLHETRLQFLHDPYSRALFVSPSGTGLKLIVAIDKLADCEPTEWPMRHRKAFAMLSAYFLDKYAIAVDPSGSDESRACFLAHDKDAFFNPNSVPFQVEMAVSGQSTSQHPAHKRVVDSIDTYDHVLTVVERIEAARVDISGGPGNYSQRLLLAFSMSTLGEPGRELLHRILAFYPNYEPAEVNAKFDEGIAKSRFKDPGKFFSLAKEYGIDVSHSSGQVLKGQTMDDRLQHSKSRDMASPTENIPAPVDKGSPSERKNAMFDFNSPVVFIKETCRIMIATKRSYSTIADNFLLYIKYVMEDEFGEKTWLLEILPYQAEPIYIEVSHDDFTSAARLKKIITGKTYSLQINDAELSKLQAYLFRETSFQTAIKITRYGYHAPSGVFFFANKAVVPGKPLLVPDTFGMIEATSPQGKPLFLSMPQNNRHKAHRFTLTDTTVTANQFFQLFAEAHLYENAVIPFCHYIMALFRDIAIRHKNFSPILFLKGGAGTGKSSIVRVLTAAFGKKQEGVNLKSKNTESALVKLMSQASNCLIWFDEFHNELNGIEGLLQAAYDNDGYHRSKDSTSSDTDAIEIHAALTLTSNYLPDNPVFFSRCVFVPITSSDKSTQQRTAFNQLQEIEDLGLGCMTVELLQYRPIVEGTYATAFEALRQGMKAEFGTEKVPERLFNNMAQTMTAAFILAQAGSIQLTESTEADDIRRDFIRFGAASIRRQHRVMGESTALTEFFEIIQSLHDQHQIRDRVHYSIRRVDGENHIQLWFPQLYTLYAQHVRRIFQKAPADKDTLQSEMAALEGLSDWEQLKKSIRFRNTPDGNTSMPRKGCCVMNYDKLQLLYGLNFEDKKPWD